MVKGNKENKFEFGLDFQKDILRFTITDKHGYKALLLYEYHYFTLIEHSFIAHGLKKFYKVNKTIPKNLSVAKEHLRQMFRHKDYINNLTENDRNTIIDILTDLYTNSVKDGEYILDEVKKFSRFVELKEVTEDFDITNFSEWDTYSKKIQKAMSKGRELEKTSGTFLVQDARARQHQRANHESVIPTPFWQINKYTNAGGFEKGSLIVLIGPQKKAKTACLVNLGRGYVNRKKNVLYIDLENGYMPLATRFEQSMLKKTKQDIESGNFDSSINKELRKLRRLGVEVHIRRLPSLTTNANHIQAIIDEIYLETGIRFQVLILDYIGNLGSISGKNDDFGRISDATLDIKNLLEVNDMDLGMTAMHVAKPSLKKFKTKFDSEDIAKCIDIPRHADAVYGIQQSDEESNGGVYRFEIIDQRDGVNNGKMFWWVDMETQRLVEFTKKEVKAYLDETGEVDTIKSVKRQVNHDLE